MSAIPEALRRDALAFRRARLEWLAAAGLCAVALAAHAAEVRWVRFGFAFAAIDLVGYLPGALAARRANGGPIPAAFHLLYDVCHSGLTAALVLGAWWAASGPEWAMLAIPLHLAGDRALFGNLCKPVGLPFEPSRGRG